MKYASYLVHCKDVLTVVHLTADDTRRPTSVCLTTQSQSLTVGSPAKCFHCAINSVEPTRVDDTVRPMHVDCVQSCVAGSSVNLHSSIPIYSVSQKKSPPAVFWIFFPNGWEFLINFLHTYYTIISTPEYKFLFKYLQLWQSYAILSATT